jgi:hypothetical protein
MGVGNHGAAGTGKDAEVKLPDRRPCCVKEPAARQDLFPVTLPFMAAFPIKKPDCMSSSLHQLQALQLGPRVLRFSPAFCHQRGFRLAFASLLTLRKINVSLNI